MARCPGWLLGAKAVAQQIQFYPSAVRLADLEASRAAPPFSHLSIGCTFVGIGREKRGGVLLVNRKLEDRLRLLNLWDRRYFGLTMRLHHLIELRPSAGTVGIGNTYHTEQHQSGYRCYSLHVSHPRSTWKT